MMESFEPDGSGRFSSLLPSSDEADASCEEEANKDACQGDDAQESLTYEETYETASHNKCHRSIENFLSEIADTGAGNKLAVRANARTKVGVGRTDSGNDSARAQSGASSELSK